MYDHCLNGADPARHQFNRSDVLSSATAATGIAMIPRTGNAQNTPPSFAVSTRIPTRGFDLRETGALVEWVEYMQRAMCPDDVVINIVYGGIYHSDIFTDRGDQLSHPPSHTPAETGKIFRECRAIRTDPRDQGLTLDHGAPQRRGLECGRRARDKSSS